jgi:shikimate dehydrogenase
MNACKGNGATPLLIETVYRPRDTATLVDARAAGWQTIDGTALFVKQAELQSAMWLGKPPEAGVFQNLVDRATSD